MNNKIFLKIGSMFILALIAYLSFVIFFLSPMINNYLSDLELKNKKSNFSKVVSSINLKLDNLKNKDMLIKDIESLLKEYSLLEKIDVYIFDTSGKVIIDINNEFKLKDISKVTLQNTKDVILLEKIKKSYNEKSEFEYFWNKKDDINNYTFPKISWVEYNKTLSWYIVPSIYKKDLSNYFQGINKFILNVSIIIFMVLTIISIILIFKVLMPIKRIFLSDQENQVEENNKILEDEILRKTREINTKFYYDELTNLKNRYALEEDIKGFDFVSVALVDIDSFDDINELYGFSTGNLVLKETANILKEFCDKFNLITYRIHGNVFSVTDKEMMEFSKYNRFISELSTLFKNKPIIVEELDIEIFIDITLGISIAQEEPLKTAGIALKKAKKGNQRFFVYNNELDTKEIIEKTIFWREKIKSALKNNTVTPFYQPIYNRKNEIVKYETLMRIKDVDAEENEIFLLPYLFLDVAVKTKQYLQLSNLVISKALEDLSKTQKQISFNLSFKDILDLDFVESLDKNLDKIDSVNKERIVFEILESDNITDYTILEDFIFKYRKLGIKIAIDDFGTGYSNFAHILKIRPDYIKIDGSLIKDIDTDKNSYEMVKSIIEFSRALNIKVIAEFIHSQEVFDLVMDLGIDEFQGFYLGKPDEHIT